MGATGRVHSIATLTERTLTAEEFDAWVNAPMSPAEADDIRALVTWFTRRYPTPAQRLAAAGRALDDQS